MTNSTVYTDPIHCPKCGSYQVVRMTQKRWRCCDCKKRWKNE